MDSNLKSIIASVDRNNVHRRHIKIVGANKKREFELHNKPETVWQMRHVPNKTQNRSDKDENEEDVL